MRVVINALSLKPCLGGGLTFGLNLSNALMRTSRGREVVLLGGDHNRALLETTGCRVVSMGGGLDRSGLRILFENTVLPRRLRALAADVYVALDGLVPPRMRSACVAVLQNLLYFHWRDVVMAHSLAYRRRCYLTLQARYFLSGWRRSIERADAFVCVSECMRAEFTRRYPAALSKSTVIPEAADARYGPGDMAAKDDAYLLGVGTLYPYKRFDLLIRLLPMLPDCPDLKICVAGPDWDDEARRLMQLAERLNVAHRIALLGHQSEAALVDLYRKATCLCLFSDFEAFALPVVEAMACGTPVIVADRSAMREVGGDAALVVDPAHLESAADHIRRLHGDAAYRRNWSERSVRRSADFAWTRVAEQYWQLFEGLRRERNKG